MTRAHHFSDGEAWLLILFCFDLSDQLFNIRTTPQEYHDNHHHFSDCETWHWDFYFGLLYLLVNMVLNIHNNHKAY